MGYRAWTRVQYKTIRYEKYPARTLDEVGGNEIKKFFSLTSCMIDLFYSRPRSACIYSTRGCSWMQSEMVNAMAEQASEKPLEST